ncbi:MAG: SDR family oxidoreductase, partial [Actinobacteria bacterium]|nr:SDR family oxidoreductase [Actinomycetota bacterium]
DLDGLLLDTEPLHARAWQQAARHFGRELSADELMALRGRRRLDCADQVRGWITASGGPALSSSELLAVRQPIANLMLSNTARAGVTGFLKTLAREVAADGVTVNSAQPGIHATDRVTQLYGSSPDASQLGIPAGVVGDPADFGKVVAFLCSEPARFITGAHVPVDGGSYAGLL